MKKATVVFITLFAAASTTARTITVDDDSPADFTTIQAAIDDANNRDTIEIQPGTYTGPGNCSVDFLGKAITVRSIDPNDPNVVAATVIDCNDSGGGVYFQHEEDGNSVLDGLTISSGLITCQPSGGRPHYDAGSPTIRNCRMISSRVICRDGARPVICDCIFTNGLGRSMHAIDCSGSALVSLTISRCLFADYFTSSDGGAISLEWCSYTNLAITDCLFTNNSAGRGGAIFFGGSSSTILIERCIFRNNSATSTGGAVRISASGSATYAVTGAICDCIFQDNFASNGGGAINATNSYGLTVTNCLFVGNRASKPGYERFRPAGGALVSDENMDNSLINCLFVGNSARYGGALSGAWTEMTIANCTFAGNTASQGSTYNESYPEGSSTIHIKDSIVWDGENSMINPNGETLITSSNIFAGWPGEGNMNVDPCFADPGYWDPNGTPEDANDDFWVDGDYHLKSQAGRWDRNSQSWVMDDVTSLCIDAGDPMNPIGNEPFPHGGIIDMGAYGGTVEASKSYFGEPPCETIVAGDINGDCRINFEDFRLMALHWCEDNSP